MTSGTKGSNTMSSEERVDRLHVGPRLSEAAIFNGTVYLAGQIAEKTKADAFEQTVEVLGHVDRLLAEAGSDKRHILQATVYLASMKHYADMNRAWDAWVEPGATPPRATVEGRLAKPEYLVEIKIIAAQTV
jgi:enamine deaminase RidA (YjgF/YER057c/UK114 family)